MRRWSPVLWAPVVLFWLLLLPRVALAQLDLQMSASAREVAVGEALQIRLDAMSEDDHAPVGPDLVVPNGFEVRGPSVGTRQQMSITNFNMVTQKGISATWLLTPTRPGLYTIGPASVQARGRRYSAEPLQVRVLPEGQRPRSRRGSRRAPVDPFNSLDPFGGSGFDDLFDRLRGGSSRFEELPAAPADLVPPRPLDSLAFVEAKLDKQRAVVGQQLTLSIYAHGAQGLFQEAPGAREPSHPDFLAHRLIEDGSRQPVYQYVLDGQRWMAVKVREIALFPIRAGHLEIGPLEFGFLGRRYGARSGDGLRRSTRALAVDVSEPPAQGRPPGFSNEVGDFELSVVVEPRTIEEGGSISVRASVRGVGRLPGALKTPEQAGLEWLEPTVRDDLAINGSVVGGSRSFSYLVRLTRAGRVELGSLTLPHYNPRTGRYQVAQAPLGSVTVSESAKAPAAVAGDAAGGPGLTELVRFRAELGPAEGPSYVADGRIYWWLLVAGPLGVLAFAGAMAFARGVRQKLQRREASQATHASRALGEAKRALAASELGAFASASERAIYNSIEWATGLRVRAVLRSELERTLQGKDLPRDVARRSAELLDRCGKLRFGAQEATDAHALLRDVEGLVKQLVRRPPARTLESVMEGASS